MKPSGYINGQFIGQLRVFSRGNDMLIIFVNYLTFVYCTNKLYVKVNFISYYLMRAGIKVK